MDFKKIRVNQFIRAKEVRVVDEQGNQLGIMPIQLALQKAQELGMDLVEISSQSNPPVCKIIDFSKFKYLQEKKEKILRKQQRTSEFKEIYLNVTISDHDLQTKLSHIKEFLQHNHPTKVIIQCKKWESGHFENNSQKLVDKIYTEFKDNSKIIQQQKDTNKIVLLITPKKGSAYETKSQITQRS